MSLELINTLVTFGTFLVIAGTAIAAIIQLRHARGSNQIAMMTKMRETFLSDEMSDAFALINTRLHEYLANPAFRYQFANPAARTADFREIINQTRFVGNYFEDMGTLLLAGLLDSKIMCMMYCNDVAHWWDMLWPLTAMARRKAPATWENFEYAAMLSKRWMAMHPNGDYPRGAPRLVSADEWLDADKQFVTSAN